MTYVAYLDEFGHIGPYIGRHDPLHNDSPVFGLAGLVLPIDQARSFATWFFQRKCELLKFEINRSGSHPAIWEKKGSALYTARNIERYQELRQFTFRFLNKIDAVGGFVFYVGIEKSRIVANHNSKVLYLAILREAIKRLDHFCTLDCSPIEDFLIVMDEHSQRDGLVTEASIAMFGNSDPRRALIEPPFQVESHRYQTVQAADWIAGLVGRLGSVWADQASYPENNIFRKYFESRIVNASRRSGIRI